MSDKTLKFIEVVILKHGDKYDYSKGLKKIQLKFLKL